MTNVLILGANGQLARKHDAGLAAVPLNSGSDLMVKMALTQGWRPVAAWASAG